ncbi:NgoFVII family restriction endonuclease [Aliivibrio sifiae]
MHNLNLLDKNGNVPSASGLNWGQHSEKNHTTLDDAYIAVRMNDIQERPDLFKPLNITKNVNVVWDDNVEMLMSFEGKQDIGPLSYPKQLSVLNNKSALGVYLKNRMCLPLGTYITKEHLENYGRTTISVSIGNNETYYLDFGV